jgi:CHAT domain-containing protein
MIQRALFVIVILLSFETRSQQLLKAIGEYGADQRAKIDSIDFIYAISINEHAGLFDIDQDGERSAKRMNTLKDRRDKSKREIARDTLELALSLYKLRLYKPAEKALYNAKEYMEASRLKMDILYMRCMSTLAITLMAQSKLYEAEEYINWAIQSSGSRFGKYSAAYIANKNSLAKLHQQLGRYGEAEKQFIESTKLAKSRFGNSMQYGVIINNKAILYQTLGRYDDGVELMKEAIKVIESTNQKSTNSTTSFDSRRFQINLAIMYHNAGRLPEAEAAYLDLKRIYEHRKQTNNPEYAGLLNQLGILYIQMKEVDKVEVYLKESSIIYQSKYSEQHPLYAKAISDLGNFYRMQGRYTMAEPLLIEALAVRESSLGTDHPDYVNSQESLAILHWKTGSMENANRLYNDVMNKTVNFIDRYFPPMSEAEKTKFWDITKYRFQRFFNFAIDASGILENSVEDIFNYQMATKALLLNTSTKIREQILKSSDEKLKNDYLGWLDQKENLAKLYSYSRDELRLQGINLTELEQKANEMERSLSERSSEFSIGYTTEKVSYKDVLELLDDAEAVVDLVRVNIFDQEFTNESRYIALILKKEHNSPILIELENGAELETRYAKYYRNSILQQIDENLSYKKYWAAIDRELSGKKVVYISSDGVYNQINVNTLKNDDGEYLLTKTNYITLGNSKDLFALRSKQPVTRDKSAVLLGYPDFKERDVFPLPGTKIELDNIAKVLKESDYNVIEFREIHASEKNLKSVNAPSLLHIATHGYFINDGELAGNSIFGVNSENANNNPLLRSGLILAGVGQVVENSINEDLISQDNGILTAYEAMNLNLEGTELVILSACETGLGEIKSGEGVYGLQRAFQIAGASTIIMSLWKVDDSATQLLMTYFYSNWLTSGNKQEAFKKAQLQLMTIYKEPYYWGAFTMLGL